jgi:DNA-binding MarR family transcriptional regulator
VTVDVPGLMGTHALHGLAEREAMAKHAPAARGSAAGTSGNTIGAAITIALLRVINKIQQGRRVPRDYGAGVAMTLLEAEICAQIAGNEGVTGGELSDELAVTRSATSQVISKLKAKGLVIEHISKRDAKRKQLSLTASGHHAAAIAEEFKAAMAEALFGGESAAELRAYLRFVTKLEAFHSEVLARWDTQGR